ncbi:MAG: VOC family protein [Bacteroidales bacterium]|nr:VOC family protein [Bacteroidales bacterium]
MTLQHLGLTVNDPEEIKNFYEEILLFSMKHQFTLDAKITGKIFGMTKNIDVCLMEYQNTRFEIFTDPIPERKTFTHICLAYPEHEAIYSKAIKKGYKGTIKENPGHNTCFIWDNSGNMFEIKPLQNNIK